MTKMAEIDTLFLSKTAENPAVWLHIPTQPYKRIPPKGNFVFMPYHTLSTRRRIGTAAMIPPWSPITKS